MPAAVAAVAPLMVAGDARMKLPLFLGLPPERAGRPPGLDAVIDHVANSMRATGLGVGSVTMIETGHAAGTMALREAWQVIRRGAAHVAVAGGVDLFLEPETLELLEAEDQLHSAGPDNNPYGFIPGEAAAFVLLASAEAAQHLRLEAGLDLVVSALAHETKLIKMDDVCIGEGLTELFRRLSGSLPAGTTVDDLYCDMNGEPYRADEFGFASVRAGRMFKDVSKFMSPADCWGDVGAASGPLLLILADAAARRGYGTGPLSAAFTSSESGERAGFIVRAPNAQAADWC